MSSCPSSNSKTILFISSNSWGAYLAQLSSQAQNPYRFQILSLRTNEILSFKGMLYFLRSTHIVRVGLPPLVPSAKNLVLDFVLLAFSMILANKAKQFCYWIGSDVLYYKKSRGPIYSALRYILFSSTNHIAGSPWLGQELLELGIASKSLIFPYMLKARSPNWPREKLHISWYLPDNNPVSYGRLHLDAIVNAFPEIVVDVYGTDRYWHDGLCPSNIKLHGWLSDPITLIRRCQIHARVISHDSLGGSVRDALSSASHVIYTYALPFCNIAYYSDVANTLSIVNAYYHQFLDGKLAPNYQGQAWVIENLSTSSLANKFFQYLLK